MEHSMVERVVAMRQLNMEWKEWNGWNGKPQNKRISLNPKYELKKEKIPERLFVDCDLIKK